MQQISFLPGEMTPGERSLIQRALKTLDRHLHEPGVAFTSTRAAREWLILNMAGLEREEFRVLYLNNQNQLIAGETLFTGTINRTEVHVPGSVLNAPVPQCRSPWYWHTITRPVKSHPVRQTGLSPNVWYRHWAWWISGCRTI